MTTSRRELERLMARKFDASLPVIFQIPDQAEESATRLEMLPSEEERRLHEAQETLSEVLRAVHASDDSR